MKMTIGIAKIRLYLDNPRLSKSYNEREALYKIVEDQQKKLVNIAKDIMEFGLSELDSIAVFPDKEPGFYCVAEGNRRISALKLIQNPALIADKYPVIAREIGSIKVSKDFNFDNIEVSVFRSEDDPKLIHFLELRHLGEQNGVGTVRWDAKQKGRFDYRVYGKENLVIFLDSLERQGVLTAAQIEGVTKTNWDRILRPVGQEFLGLTKEAGTYIIPESRKEEFTKKIRLVADALHGQTVGRVYGQEQIEKFFDDMQRKYLGESEADPDLAGAAEVSGKGDVPANDFSKSGDKEDARKPTSYMPRDPFKGCKTVIPPSLRLQSRNHRITLMINELKTLQVESYANACGCLLRALIELSAKEYLEYSGFKDDATTIEFQEAISTACKKLYEAGKMNKDLMRIIKKETEAGGVRSLFNGYMHNTDAYPSPKVIQTIFLTYQEFIRQCLL